MSPTLQDGDEVYFDTKPRREISIDDIVLVSAKEIAEGISYAYWHESQIVEGAGAVSIASLLNNKFSPKGPSLALLWG